jgi:hypothetical protein
VPAFRDRVQQQAGGRCSAPKKAARAKRPSSDPARHGVSRRQARHLKDTAVTTVSVPCESRPRARPESAGKFAARKRNWARARRSPEQKSLSPSDPANGANGATAQLGDQALRPEGRGARWLGCKVAEWLRSGRARPAGQLRDDATEPQCVCALSGSGFSDSKF